MEWPRHVMGLIWVVWAISWIAASFWARQTQARAGLAAEASYRITLLLGFVATFAPFFLREPPDLAWAPLAQWLFDLLAAAGFAFCWWARLELGPLWSGTITRKADHKIIDTGPYAIVRHPIYTGILIAALAATLIQAKLISVLGLVLTIAGFYQKARLEEGFLRKELGAAGYDAYAARVPMLIPFWPMKGAA